MRAAAAAAGPEDVTEAERVPQAGKDIGEVGEDCRIEARPSPRAADAGMAESVVEAALLVVGQHGIGLGRFLEELFRLCVAGVPIRMVLQREFPIGALDLAFAGLALDAEDLVIITLAHAGPHASPFATFTIEGRSNRSPSM